MTELGSLDALDPLLRAGSAKDSEFFSVRSIIALLVEIDSLTDSDGR